MTRVGNKKTLLSATVDFALFVFVFCFINWVLIFFFFFFKPRQLIMLMITISPFTADSCYPTIQCHTIQIVPASNRRLMLRSSAYWSLQSVLPCSNMSDDAYDG